MRNERLVIGRDTLFKNSDLKGDRLVEHLIGEVSSANSAARLSYLMAEAALSEADNRLTRDQAQPFYGLLAIQASNMAKSLESDNIDFYNSETSIQAQTLIIIALKAVDYVRRGLTDDVEK